MQAVLLTGHGGLDKLQFRSDVPVPVPTASEVLIKVTAAGVNNTDINTTQRVKSPQLTTMKGDWSVTIMMKKAI